MSFSVWYLRGVKPFAGLSPEELEKLAKTSTTEKVKKDQQIHLPGGGGKVIYLLKSGRIKIVRLRRGEDNRKLTLVCLEPEEIFGELDRVEDSSGKTVIETLEEAVIWMTPREHFERLLEQIPEPVIKLIKRRGLRTREIKTNIKELLFKSATERLAGLLLKLAAEDGVTQPLGIRLGIRLSYQELADLTAATKKNILMALAVLKRKGFIDLGRKDIFIKDKEGLAKLSSSRVNP
ncbi:MAG: Crp/Fnr family transcriptional regulator [Deltaproteobacteria bacterium]|nr:MAG: Crp/Fnr family transcriptional regulator [Deltaproteobacteria bacterium]